MRMVFGKSVVSLIQISLTKLYLKTAPTARYIKARGKREARRPWLVTPKKGQGLKGRNIIPPFQGLTLFFILLPGATRYALAPGYNIPRRWRSLVHVHIRAVGAACPTFISAPLALLGPTFIFRAVRAPWPNFHIRRWRCESEVELNRELNQTRITGR